jgi:Bardet-Biedl syndrome 7 protein
VFLATGSQIRGFTKKGKEFFKLDSSHTDAIVHLHVQSQELWSTGKHTLNCYSSTEARIFDKYFYLAEDVISHMMVTIHLNVAFAIIAV